MVMFTPRAYPKLIEYRDAEASLYALIDALNADDRGIDATVMQRLTALRDVILPHDSADDDEFNESYTYDYVSNRYAYKPLKEYSVTVVVTATKTVLARDVDHAKELVSDEFDDDGMNAFEEASTKFTTVYCIE